MNLSWHIDPEEIRRKLGEAADIFTKEQMDKALEDMRRRNPVDTGFLSGQLRPPHYSAYRYNVEIVKPLESESEAQEFHDEVAAFLALSRGA